MDVDDVFRLAIGVGLLQRLENAVGAGLVVAACHHHVETGVLNGCKYLLVVDCDNDSFRTGLACAQRHLHDHWPAANIRERLAWKACGCHPGLYKDHRFLEIPILHPTPFKSRPKTVKTSRSGDHHSSCAGCAKAIAFE